MESNAEDKMMRDKLKEIQFPFDPAAWDKMEAMLGKEKKRRGFFWWWFSGAALVTLLASGVGYFMLYNQPANKQLLAGQKNVNETTSTLAPTTANNNAAVTSISPINEETVTTPINKTQGIEKNTSTELAEQKNVLNQTKKQQAQKISASNKKQTNSAKVIQSESAVSIFSTRPVEAPLINEQVHTVPTESATPVSMLNNTAGQEGVISNRPNKTITPNEQGGTSTELTNEQFAIGSENETLATPAGISLPEEVKVEEAIAPATDSTKEEEQPESKPVPDQQKIKKKMAFNYALGAAGGITASVVKSNPDKNVRDGIYKKPSFSAGFVQEFIFAKRVGIVSGVMYSVTSYDVDSPKTWTLPKSPSYYSSSLSEVQIPIGIKVYPVAKDNIKFFIAAGVINHIKIKENFSYTGPKNDTIVEPTKTVVTNTFYPQETDLNGTGYGQITSQDILNLTALPSTTSQTVNTEDFAVNGVSRYYTSFYASMGIDFVIKKHLVLSAEPTFFMLLQKIGVQEKRKYNFGLNVGMKYMFGN